MANVSPRSIGTLLRAAAPDELIEVAEGYARGAYGVGQLDVLLADYRISGLSPVLHEPHGAAGPLSADSSAARCFGSQQSTVERVADGGWRVFVPVTVWGERLGVLAADYPPDREPGPPDELYPLADELAVALIAADRSTDRYRAARRRRRMTMAAEMQWDMLPGRSLYRPEFLVAGQLEPAYTICGDHFDWAVTGDLLTVTVLNGFGEGIEATLLTAVAVNAMRNARRSGGDLVEQAELASDAVFQQYGGQRHAATLLFTVDLASGLLTAIDAGSPVALLRRAGQWRPVALERQLPLGMFGETRYTPQQVPLEPGDRLLVISDGVHAAAPAGQPAFGERALSHALRRTGLLPATEAVGAVMRSVQEYHQGEDLMDDAVIVCLDWQGRPA